MSLPRKFILTALMAGCAAAPAQAVNVTLSGLVVNLCVLTLSTPGTLASSADGTELSSDQTGGLPATLTVVATGSAPTINFTAPSLQAPGGASGSITKAIGYTSLSGAAQGYTSSSSSYTQPGLLDTFTVKGKLNSAVGFSTGTYTISTTATCQQ